MKQTDTKELTERLGIAQLNHTKSNVKRR